MLSNWGVNPNQPGRDSQYRRYDRIYYAFMSAGIPLMGLIGGTKRPWHDSAPQSLLRDLNQVEAAMDAGLNVGAVTHQEELRDINPLGFWDLDIDGPEHGLDLSPFIYRVRRSRQSVKAHYLARLPDPTVSLAASYKGKDYDICTWNTVMPGSIHEDSSVYELEYLEDGIWVPWDGESFRVDMLPVIDPEQYRSLENQRKESRSCNVQRLRTTGSHGNASMAVSVWVRATGTYTTRIKMAKHYLRRYAWKSISGMNGHDTLLVVMVNLRLFYRLEDSLALAMVKEYFNSRCVDLHGDPCPWSDAEILHKWNQAGKPGMYPTLGVKNPKAKRKRAMLTLQGEVEEFLGRFTQEGGSSNPTMLRQAFIAFKGGEDVNPTAFGRAVSKVMGIHTTTPNGKRLYYGFQLSEAGSGFTRKGWEAA